MAAGDSLDHSGFFKIWAKSLLFRQRWTNYRITCVIQTFLAFLKPDLPWEAVLKKVRLLFRECQKQKREVQNPVEEGFAQTVFEMSEQKKTKPFSTGHDGFFDPPHTVPPLQPWARPYNRLQSCNALHNGVLLHERYPWHQCKSHTRCHKHVVKFRYRITEEKHTNTTVKSSHYGKIEGIEYWGTSHWLKVGSYPLQHWEVLWSLCRGPFCFSTGRIRRGQCLNKTLCKI